MEAKSLKDVFKSFTGGKPEMESKVYAKLYKETGIIDKKFTVNDADINFSKVKSGKVKVITFDQFEKTLELAAAKKGTTKDALVQKIIAHGGATYAGTKADYVKFHDDKSTYTGVYAGGRSDPHAERRMRLPHRILPGFPHAAVRRAEDLKKIICRCSFFRW